MPDLGERLYRQAGYRRGDPLQERLARLECALYAVEGVLGWAGPDREGLAAPTRAVLGLCLLAGSVGADPLAIVGQVGLLAPAAEPADGDPWSHQDALVLAARALADRHLTGRWPELLVALGGTIALLRAAARRAGRADPLEQVRRMAEDDRWRRGATWPFAPLPAADWRLPAADRGR